MARSGIVWLGSSGTEIAAAREALRKAQQPGVLDELGFQILQAAFADRLYPGVNTIMTRARYLVFVPAIYRHIEEHGLARGRDADRVARGLQDELREGLSRNERGSVIGIEAGREIRRPPSNIYWNALIELGIATRSTGETAYQEQLSSGLIGGREVADDDNRLHDDTVESLWDPELRTNDALVGGQFPASTSFRLTRREATDLRDRYGRLKREGDLTLLTSLVRWGEGREKLPPAVHRPWDVPTTALTPRLRVVVEHARLLSLFAAGTTIQYWGLLLEKRGDEHPGYQEGFEAWWALAREALVDWNLDGMVRVAGDLKGLRPGDSRFVEAWCDRLRAARTPRALLDDPGARELIRLREKDRRGAKARLKGGLHMKSWNPPRFTRASPAPTHLLTYRHATGQQFARDILDGLSRGTS